MTAPWLVVSVHDVAPGTAEACRDWCATLDLLSVPASLLVVAGPWRGGALADDPGLAAWLQQRCAGGDEVVQHGWTHVAPPGGPAWRRAVGAAVARGAGEFWTLDEAEARRRLELGRDALGAAGLVADGFTPPGWLASPATSVALRSLGFGFTTDHGGVRDLRTGAGHRAPALSHRPGTFGERLGARLMPAVAARRARADRPVRIALHPDDLDRPGLRAATVSAIDAALTAGARPCTYGDVVAAPALAREGAG